jgi:hypothetical protein
MVRHVHSALERRQNQGNPNKSALGQDRKSSMRANVFRFAPKNGHCPMQSACPFGAANSGHGAVYSITSSARARRVAGTCKPNPLADGWLITNSNSVGA